VPQSNGPLRILTFGDGLGIDAYYLALFGHDVTYFEPSQPCANFARRIFDRGNLTVAMLSTQDQLAGKSFDAVVCLDVLEHVPEPSRLVGWLSSVLKPMGQLIINAPFQYIDRAVSTHLRANRRYSGDMKSLYQPHGLHMVAGRLFWNPVVLRKYPPNQVPKKGAPLQLRLGSHLLRSGRRFPRPHIVITKLLLRKRSLAAMVEPRKAA
jgi:SAM-dependent methyltransferase